MISRKRFREGLKHAKRRCWWAFRWRKRPEAEAGPCPHDHPEVAWHLQRRRKTTTPCSCAVCSKDPDWIGPAARDVRRKDAMDQGEKEER